MKTLSVRSNSMALHDIKKADMRLVNNIFELLLLIRPFSFQKTNVHYKK
jgi:hypothetical protein